jgi:hypothetical protein
MRGYCQHQYAECRIRHSVHGCTYSSQTLDKIVQIKKGP